MIVLNLKLQNIYMFNDTFLDFTYPKKTPNSTIEYEYLEEFPLIKFKRVNIIMGANASGKTSFGKLLRDILNYLLGRDVEHLAKIINNKNKKAQIEIVYILPFEKELRKIKIEFDTKNIIKEYIQSIKLKKSWNLKKSLDSLSNSKPIFNFDIQKSDIVKPGFKSIAVSKGIKLLPKKTEWYFQFSDGKDNLIYFKYQDVKLLEKILKNFDSSIKKVKKLDKKIYLIEFNNKDKVLVDDGVILDKERLSRGTQEAIEIASFLNAIIKMDNSSAIFYLDEKLAYSHSEIEIAILNLIIEKLNRYSQFFYTTHNYEVLNMNLPTHSFLFFKNENNNIKAIYPEKLKYTKNDRSLINYVKNDVFGTLPDTNLIDELL